MGNEKELYTTILNDRTMQTEIVRAPNDEARIKTIVQMDETQRLPVSPEAVADFFRHQDTELSADEVWERVDR